MFGSGTATFPSSSNAFRAFLRKPAFSRRLRAQPAFPIDLTFFQVVENELESDDSDAMSPNPYCSCTQQNMSDQL